MTVIDRMIQKNPDVLVLIRRLDLTHLKNPEYIDPVQKVSNQVRDTIRKIRLSG